MEHDNRSPGIRLPALGDRSPASIVFDNSLNSWVQVKATMKLSSSRVPSGGNAVGAEAPRVRPSFEAAAGRRHLRVCEGIRGGSREMKWL
jgi:hypothetical protein